MNSEIYERYTGKLNIQVRESLVELLQLVPTERIWLRVPLINGYNTSKDIKINVAKLTEMSFTNIERFEYIVYR